MSYVIRIRKNKFKPTLTYNKFTARKDKEYIEVDRTDKGKLKIEINNLVIYVNALPIVDNATIDLQGVEILANHTQLQVFQNRKRKTKKTIEHTISLLNRD